MKTKQVPAIVMLTAGFIVCIISIVQHMEFGKFLKVLLLVLICFYILGCITQIILEKNFGEMQEDAAEEAETEEQTDETEQLENIESEGEEEN